MPSNMVGSERFTIDHGGDGRRSKVRSKLFLVVEIEFLENSRHSRVCKVGFCFAEW